EGVYRGQTDVTPEIVRIKRDRFFELALALFKSIGRFELARVLAVGARVRRSAGDRDRKSTRLNSSHLVISYAVFCLKKKNNRYRRSSRAGAFPAQLAWVDRHDIGNHRTCEARPWLRQRLSPLVAGSSFSFLTGMTVA